VHAHELSPNHDISGVRTTRVSEYSFYCGVAAEFLWGEKVALVFEVTNRTSRSKGVDEIRGAILAEVIKRDFLEEILRGCASANRTNKDERDQTNHETPHKKRK
jgi:hypothetical protein